MGTFMLVNKSRYLAESQLLRLIRVRCRYLRLELVLGPGLRVRFDLYTSAKRARG